MPSESNRMFWNWLVNSLPWSLTSVAGTPLSYMNLSRRVRVTVAAVLSGIA